MKLLTGWDWDKMTTICISFPNTFFQTNKKTLQFVLKGAVNRKSKFVQAMAGPEKTLIHYLSQWCSMANDAYMSLSDWLSWLLHVLERYIHAEKNGTVWPHEGYLHPHSWKRAIPTPRVGSGRRTGWPYFVKSPVARSDCGMVPWRPLADPGIGYALFDERLVHCQSKPMILQVVCLFFFTLRLNFFTRLWRDSCFLKASVAGFSLLTSLWMSLHMCL